MKDAGKHLWKRMARRQVGSHKKRDEEADEEEPEEEEEEEGEGDEIRQVVFIEGEEGVAIQFPKGLSQTETVGRGYTWRTVSVIATPKEALTQSASRDTEEEKAAASPD